MTGEDTTERDRVLRRADELVRMLLTARVASSDPKTDETYTAFAGDIVDEMIASPRLIGAFVLTSTQYAHDLLTGCANAIGATPEELLSEFFVRVEIENGPSEPE